MSEFDFESRSPKRERSVKGYHPFTWGCGLYLGITFAGITCLAAMFLICFGIPSLAMIGTTKYELENKAKLLKEATTPMKEPDLQKKRARLIDKLKQRNVFLKVDAKYVTVGSRWASCTIDEKRAFASVVYSYIFDTKSREPLHQDDRRAIILKDDYDIEIGRYGGSHGGLILQEDMK